MAIRVFSMLASFAIVLAGATSASAGAVQLRQIPAEAQWLAHIDADAMRSSSVTQKFHDEFIAGRRPAEWFNMIGRQWGVDIRRDLHSLTLYGTEFGRSQGVMIVRADMDRSSLVKRVEQAADHRITTYRDYSIHTWSHQKDGKSMTLAGVLHTPGVLVVASSVDTLKSALDVMDGRGESLAGSKSPLAAKVPAGTMELVRAHGIQESVLSETLPICSQLRHIDYVEGQRQGKWFANLTVASENEKVAQHVKAGLEGLLAVFWLHVDAAPELQALLGRVDISQSDHVVHVNFRAPVKEVTAAMPTARELIKWHRDDGMASRQKRVEKERETATASAGVTTKRSSKKRSSKSTADSSPDTAIAEASGKRSQSESRGKRSKAKSAKGRAKTEMAGRTEGTAVLGVTVGDPRNVDGAGVLRVWEGSPAQEAGIQSGDVVVQLEGKQIESAAALRDAIAGHEPGDEIKMVFQRDGQTKEVEVRLAAGDVFGTGSAPAAGLRGLLSPQPWLGIHIAPSTGVGVNIGGVLLGSPAHLAGLAPGDTVLRVDGTEVETPDDLRAAIAKCRPGETIQLAVQRDGDRQEIDVTLGAFGLLESRDPGRVRQRFQDFLEGRLPTTNGEEEPSNKRSNQTADEQQKR